MQSSSMSKCSLLTSLFLFGVIAGNTSFAQSGENPIEIDLNRSLPRNVAGSSIKETVDSLSAINHLSIGLVLSDNPDRPTRSANIKAGTIREMLDSIITNHPGYRWSIVDGVINIVPVQGPDPALDAILDAPVLEFSETRKLERRDLLGVIDNETLNSSGRQNSTQIAVIMGIWKYDSDSYELCGCTTRSLRSTLNSIIKQSNRYRIWILSKDKDGVLLDF